MSWTGPDCFAGLKADLTTDSDVATVVSDVKAYLGTTFGPNMAGDVAVLTLTKPEVLASLDHYKTYLDSQFDDSAHFSKGQSQMLARLRSQVAAMATLGHFLNGDSGLAGQKLDNAIALLQKNWAKKTFFHKDIGVPHAALMASAKPKLDQLLSNAPIEIHPTVGEAANAIPDAGDGGTVDTGAADTAEAAPAEASTATSTGWTPPFVPGADNDLNPGDHIYTHDDGTPHGQIVVVTPSGLMGELSQDAFDLIPEDEAKALADHGFPGFTDQGVWGAPVTAAEEAVAEHAYAFYGLSITPTQAAKALAELPSGIINVNTETAVFGPGFNLAAFTHAKDAAGGGSYTAFYKAELEKIASKVGTAPTGLSIGGIQFTKDQADAILADIAHGQTWQAAFAGVGIADDNGALSPVYDWINDEYDAVPGPHGHIEPKDLIAKYLGGPDLPEAAPWPPPTLGTATDLLPPITSPEGQALVHAAAAGNALADAVQTGDHGVDIAGVHLTTAQAQDFQTALEHHADWGNWVYDNLPNPTTSLDAIQAWVTQTTQGALDTDQENIALLKHLKDGLAVPSAATVDLFGFQAPAAKAQELLELMKAKTFATPSNPNGPVKSYLDHVFGDSYKATTPGSNIDLDEVNAYVQAQTGAGTLGAGPSGVFDAYVSKLESLGLTATAHPDPLAHLPVVTHLTLGNGAEGHPVLPGDVVHEKVYETHGQTIQAAVHPDGTAHYASGGDVLPSLTDTIKNDANGWQTVAKGPEAAPAEAELPVVDHLNYVTNGVSVPVGSGDVVYESPSGAQYVVHPGGGQAPSYISSHTQTGNASGETAETLTQAGWKPVAKGPDVAALPAVPTVPVFDGSTLPPTLLAKLAPGDQILTHPGTNTIVLKHLDGSYDTAGPDTVTASHWNPGESGAFTEDNGWKSVGTIPGTPAVGDLPVVTHATTNEGGVGTIVAPGDVVHQNDIGVQVVVHSDGSATHAGGTAVLSADTKAKIAAGDGWHPVGKGPDLAVTPTGLQILHDDGSFTNLSDANISQAVKDIIQPGDTVWAGPGTSYVQHEGATELVKVVNASGSITSVNATPGVLHALDSPTGGWAKHTIAGGSHPAIADLQHAATADAAESAELAHSALEVTHLDGTTSNLADLTISTAAKDLAQPGDVIYSKDTADSAAYIKHPDGTQVYKGSGNVLFQPSTSNAEELLTDPATPGWSKYTVSGPAPLATDIPADVLAYVEPGDHIYSNGSGTTHWVVHPDGTVSEKTALDQTFVPSGATHQDILDQVGPGLSTQDKGVVPGAASVGAAAADKIASGQDMVKVAWDETQPGDKVYKGTSYTYLHHPTGTITAVNNGTGVFSEITAFPQGVESYIDNLQANLGATYLGVVPDKLDIPKGAQFFAKPGDHIYTNLTPGSTATYFVHPDGQVGSYSQLQGFVDNGTSLTKAQLEEMVTDVHPGIADKGVWGGATAAPVAVVYPDIPSAAVPFAKPGDHLWTTGGGITYYVHPDNTVGKYGPGGYTETGIAPSSVASASSTTDKGVWPVGPGPSFVPPAPVAAGQDAMDLVTSLPANVMSHLQPGDAVYKSTGPSASHYLVHTDGTVSTVGGVSGAYTQSSIASPNTINNWVTSGDVTHLGTLPAVVSVPDPNVVLPNVSVPTHLIQPGDHIFEGDGGDTTWLVHADGTTSIHYAGDDYLSTSTATEAGLANNNAITDKGVWPGAAVAPVAGPVLTVGGGLSGVSQEIYDLALPGDKLYEGPDKTYFVHPDGSVSALYDGDSALSHLPTSAMGGEESDFKDNSDYTVLGVKPVTPVAALPDIPVAAAPFAKPGDKLYTSHIGNVFYVHPDGTVSKFDTTAEHYSDLPGSDESDFQGSPNHTYKGVWPTPALPASLPPGVAAAILAPPVVHATVVAAPADAKAISDLPALLQPKAQAGDTWYFKANTGHHYVVHADGTGHGLGPTASHATAINPGNQIAHSVKQGTIFDGSALPAVAAAPVPSVSAAAAALAKPGDHLYADSGPAATTYFAHPDGTVDVLYSTESTLESSGLHEDYVKTQYDDKGIWPGSVLPVAPTADTFWSMPSALPGQNIQFIAHPDGSAHLITPGTAQPVLISAGGFDPTNPAFAGIHQTATLEAPSVDPLAFLLKAPGDKPDAFNSLGSYAQSHLFTPQQGYNGAWSYNYNPDVLSTGYGAGPNFTKDYLTQVGIDPLDAPLKVQMQAVVAHATDNKSALALLLPQFPSINAAAAKAPTVLVGLKPLTLAKIEELKGLVNAYQPGVPNNLKGVVAIEKVKEWGAVTTGVNSAFKTAKSKNGVLTYLNNYSSMAKAQEMAVNPNLTVDLLYDPQASLSATHLSTAANTAALSNSAGMPSTGVLQGPKIFAAAPMPGGGGYSSSRDIAQFNFIFKPHPTSADGSAKKVGALATGVHPKEILVDQYGQEWLYKPAPEIMRADAEHYGMILQRAFTGVAPTSGVIKGVDIKGDYKAAPGEVGVVQRMFQKASDLKNVDVTTLTDFHLRDIMSAHVFDWLIANDDSKPDNLMVLNNNRIAGIDKARAFRHFGADKLALGSLDGNAPTIYTTVYNYFISQLKYGTDQDKEAIAKLYAFTIQRAKLTGTMMSDDDYRAVLAKLFEKRTDWSATAYSNKAQVMDAAVFRKNNMADDFTKLWKQIYNQAGVDIPDISTEPTRLVADELTGRSSDLWEEVKTVSAGGKATFFASTDLEAGAEFWWQALRDKGGQTGIPELRGEIKLLKDADTKLHTWLQSHEINPAQGSSYGVHATPATVPGAHHPTTAIPTNTTPALPGQAKAWKALFEYAKTVNTHANDGDYNAEKIAAGEALKTALDDLGTADTKATMNAKLAAQDFFPKTPLTNAQYPGFVDMVAHYSEQVKIPEVAKAAQVKTASKVADFDYVPPSTNPMGLPANVYGLVVPGDHVYKSGSVTWFVHADGTVSKAEGGAYSSVPSAENPGGYAAIMANTDKGVEPGAEPFDPAKAPVAPPAAPDKIHVQSVTSYNNLNFELGKYDPATGLTTYSDDWFAHHTSNTSGVSWGSSATGTNYRIDFGNGVHAEYTPWQSHSGTHSGIVAAQGRFRITVENWTGDDSQLEPYYAMLHDIGMDLTPATEESLQLQYWAMLTGTVKGRSDSSQYQPALAYIQSHVKADTKPADAIAAYREAWKLVWDPQLVDEADWRPHFQHEDPLHPTTLTGRPFWNRPDKSYADLVHAQGNKGLKNIASNLTGDNVNTSDIVKSGGMVSNDEKIRKLGLGPGSGNMSPTQDFNTGGANYVFTRLNGKASGVYYNPDAMLRMSTASFWSDNFGDVNAIKSTPWDIPPGTNWTNERNETNFKNAMTVLDDIEVMAMSTSERNKVLSYMAANGITDIRGLAPEDRFITIPPGSSSYLNEALTKAWNVWKARRGILTAAQTTRKWEESPEGIAEAAARAKYLADHPGSH